MAAAGKKLTVGARVLDFGGTAGAIERTSSGADNEYIQHRKARILAMISKVSPLGSVRVRVDPKGKSKQKVANLRLLDRIAATLLAKEFPNSIKVVDFGEHISVTKTSTLGAQTTTSDRAYFEGKGTLYGGELAAQKLEEADLMIQSKKVRL